MIIAEIGGRQSPIFFIYKSFTFFLRDFQSIASQARATLAGHDVAIEPRPFGIWALGKLRLSEARLVGDWHLAVFADRETDVQANRRSVSRG